MLRAMLPTAMDPSTAVGLEGLNTELTRQASMISYDNIFSWIVPAVALLTPLVFLIGRERNVVATAVAAHAE